MLYWSIGAQLLLCHGNYTFILDIFSTCILKGVLSFIPNVIFILNE